ncbi:hypothetical protein ACS0TY_015706 [Phlomoides rotata]
MHSTPEDADDKFIEELPRTLFMDSVELHKWEGFWFLAPILKSTITFRSSFQARDDDVFLASSMKTGTTWLKALAHCIMQNHQTLDSNDILAKKNPHLVVNTIEAGSLLIEPPPIDPYDASAARLLHTHLPYSLLPDSVKKSKCKIVYIVRNPKDTLISTWHFFNSIYRPNQEPFPLEKMVDCFCSGIHLWGPFFEHVVGYWEESKKCPEKILFLKYEELKSGPQKQVSRIAEFLGRPLTGGEAAEVVERCSFERLKNLEVNKSGPPFSMAQNSSFFRKGVDGDSNNYLTPKMKMQIDQASHLKLEPFGLIL